MTFLFFLFSDHSIYLFHNNPRMTARDQIRAMLDQLMGTDNGTFNYKLIEKKIVFFKLTIYFLLRNNLIGKKSTFLFLLSLIIITTLFFSSLKIERVYLFLSYIDYKYLLSHTLSLNAMFLANVMMNMSMLGLISSASSSYYKLNIVSI